MTAKDEPQTLTDADISSERIVSRRSLLGTLGIGAGVVATAAFGAVTPGQTAVVDRHIGDIVGSPAINPKKGKKKSIKTSKPKGKSTK